MRIKGLIEEDFIQYKKPSMFIIFPTCTFKCEKECGRKVCQNATLATSPDIEVGVKTIINRYVNNPITSAIVCGGLEPFDACDNLLQLVSYLRTHWNDDVVIYTGYKEKEIQDKIDILKQFPNIIIKFGRFIPNQKSHYDDVLGVQLASPNQYARRIS